MEIKDWFKVNESEYDCKSSSYNVYLTNSELKRLDDIRVRNSNLLKKQANARSTMIRMIIENTYLYLNNQERSFSKDVDEILEKKYFKDSIDRIFKKKLQEGNKEYEFILELVRIQLLKVLSKRSLDEDEELIKVQFRLAKDDENMLRIIGGKACLSMDDFLSGYLRYFLSLPSDTQNYILTYPKLLKLDRAIKEGQCVIIDGIKYRPYKIINSHTLLMRKSLLCFDAYCDSFCEIFNVYDKNIDYIEEYYEFNSYEKEVIDAYNKLDYIDISFKLLNDENKDINGLINAERTSIVVERKHEFPLEKIRIKYFTNIIKMLEKANKKNIDYLCYSDNYNRYMKLIQEKKEDFDKYQKELKKSCK